MTRTRATLWMSRTKNLQGHLNLIKLCLTYLANKIGHIYIAISFLNNFLYLFDPQINTPMGRVLFERRPLRNLRSVERRPRYFGPQTWNGHEDSGDNKPLLPFQYQWYVRFILKPDQKRFYWVIFESSNCDHCWTLSELPFPMGESSCKKSTVAGKLVLVVAVKRSCHLFICNRSRKSLRASSTSSASSTKPTSTSSTTTVAEKRWGSSGCPTGSWLLITG